MDLLDDKQLMVVPSASSTTATGGRFEQFSQNFGSELAEFEQYREVESVVEAVPAPAEWIEAEVVIQEAVPTTLPDGQTDDFGLDWTTENQSIPKFSNYSRAL